MAPKKTSVHLLHSGKDLLGADQVILGTEDGKDTMAIPNGTVVIDFGEYEGEWCKVRLLSDFEMDEVYAVHEERPRTWYVHPDDIKKTWTVTREVLVGKLLPRFKDVHPEPESEATRCSEDSSRVKRRV